VLTGSYYNLGGNLRAALILNNKGPEPLDVQPTLFNLSGQRLDIPPVTVDGTSFRIIELRDWAVPGAGFDEGSLQILHFGMDMQLGAQVRMIDSEHSLIFDEQLMQMMSMSSRLEAVWWLRSHRSNLRLILSNTSDAPLEVSVGIDGIAPRQRTPQKVYLGAHQTNVIDAEDLTDRGRGTLQKTGGFSISHTGAPGALLARAYIDEPETGFSFPIEFSDPQTAHSSKLNGGGLRLGQVAGEELTPIVVARNVGTTESTIRGSLPYTGPGGNVTVLGLPEIRLRPGEIESIEIARAIRQAGVDQRRMASAGLEFTYSSAPGSVLISALSVSGNGNQVFRVPLVDAEAQPSSTGGYPWNIGERSSTSVYVTNVTDREQQYVVQLNFPGGVYAPALKKLKPNETEVLDIRALKDNQVPDESGDKIPLSVTSGQIQWSVDGPENKVLIGRAEQADTVEGLSSSYACVSCCPASFLDAWVTPNSVTGVGGDTHQFTFFEQKENCFGTPLAPIARTPTWDSLDPNVELCCDPNGVGTAQNPGSTDARGQWLAWLWENTGSSCTKTPLDILRSALCSIRPSIGGPNTLWWFHGESPAAYPTEITLTTTCSGTSWQWSVVDNPGKVILGANGTCSISVRSAGRSDNQGDVGITVTVSGITSSTFHLTILAPTRLVQNLYHNTADGTWGYLTEIRYGIEDQFSTALPPGNLPVNEHFTTSAMNDYPTGNDWLQAEEKPGEVVTNSTFSDFIQGQRFTHVPTPQFGSENLGSEKVQHWGQEMYVGSTTNGAGRRVQSNTQQKFRDHATHEDIVSPNPN